jgi:hypothetical protein
MEHTACAANDPGLHICERFDDFSFHPTKRDSEQILLTTVSHGVR